ncbi:DUF3244 domain-containing protein [uncultured Draconibacterium sp.]|uniref:DUF3244 domain-containing protein n=1 Tax=uncultured Draconibacterium sp. TaxID=1573823 RepID=UPI002AA82C89|nr:DUF3244 domain-containing protein [uncultured Draconibacterium sp.]
MKNLAIISLIVFVLFSTATGHSSNLNLLYPSDINKEVILYGTLPVTSSRSLFKEPIYATIGSSSLNVEFLYNIGNIHLEVTNQVGECTYENNVNTQTQQSISINVSNWDSGIYEIRFVNSDGNYMYGTFEIG